MFENPASGIKRWQGGRRAVIIGVGLLLGVGQAGDAANGLSQYGARVWQMDDGLPHNCVQAIVQTRDGYLWLGTQDGLARFDGVYFTVFNKGNVPVMRNANILGLHQSRDGSLWISTGRGGLIRLKDGKFYHYGKAEGVVDDSGLGMIFEASDGSLWFGMVGGVSRYKDGKFTSFTKQTGFPVNIVRSMSEDAQGRLWLGTPQGVFCWKDGRVIRQLTTADGLRMTDVRAIYCGPHGVLCGGVGDGLSLIADGKVTTCVMDDRPAHNIITQVYPDTQGNLWVGSYDGLYRLAAGKLISQLDDEGRTFDMVNALLEDRERNIWVGSRDGLIRLRTRRFTTYAQQQGLSCNNVMSVLESRDGTIWVGTWGGGLNRLKDGIITGFNSSTPAPILVLGLLEDHSGRIWAGTDWAEGLFRLDQSGCRRFTTKQGLPNGAIRVVYEDHQDTCWAGTSRGLYQFSGERFHPFGREHGMGEEAVAAICEDRAGNLWVGTIDGLWRWQNSTLTKFTTASGLSDNTVGALYADREGSLWIGASGGLNRFKDGRFTAYTMKQGLFSNNIYEILEDDDGWLWMTSQHGVFRIYRRDFDKLDRGTVATLNSISYGKADGLASEVCSMVAKPSAWKGSDGRLWFATTRGVSVIDPNSGTKESHTAAPVVLERVIADKRPYPAEETLPVTSAVRIPPGRGELEFCYTALSFGVPEKTRFKYKLEGVDPDWVEAGSRRVAYYNHVYPGKYRFRVLARNHDNPWTESGASAEIILLPHLWQTWWFKALLGVGVALGVFGLHRLRLGQLRQLETLRLRIAADLHDEVGSNLSAISLLSRKVQKGGASPEEGREDLAAINRIAARTANSIREIVWFINPEYDTLQDLALRMEEAARTMLRGVDCQFQSSQAHYASKLPLHLRQNLFLLFKEALTNVAKHSRASRVEINVAERDHTWQLSVRDNGVGFHPDAAHSGNGLKNLRQRAARLAGTLEIKSQPGQGTNVSFSMRMP